MFERGLSVLEIMGFQSFSAVGFLYVVFPAMYLGLLSVKRIGSVWISILLSVLFFYPCVCTLYACFWRLSMYVLKRQTSFSTTCKEIDYTPLDSVAMSGL